MEQSHLAMQFDPALVVVSWLVALFAAYSAVSTIDQVRNQRGPIWLWAGAMAFGAGVWAMHFVGMKAMDIGTPISFDLGITAVSVVFSVLGAAAAFSLVARAKVGFGQLLLGGVALGSGIGGMHYVGMAGIKSNVTSSYDLTILAVSVVVAVVISTFGLFVMTNRILERFAARNLLVAAIVGAAIPLMHYVGMYAVKFTLVAEDTTIHSSGFFAATLTINIFVMFAVLLMALPLFATSLVQTQSGSTEVES